MKYGWIIFVLFQLVLLLSMQPKEASGECCLPSNNRCADGTKKTPCCGYKPCDILCCKCKCRRRKRWDRNRHGEHSQRSSRRHDHHHTHDRDHHHKHKGKHSDSCKYTILAMWTSKE
ncbi:uncharacterized protein LOC133842626 isoform X2 [Drosophila sulfurigaster albostrigata]|uniref:uncharacterized protein LOC133842626 isoform X2 n=1 Tax=Drosophila sulfurigaster albostrigata TaxID=89887 RepID=UPI002D2183BE|nr:uncharacterized protein LOC133842626 isoform X2 [Drosophila sulfurigaster albostrigata]